MRIMFVEDEPETIQPVRDIIQERIGNFEIKVSNFADAADLLRSFRPDLVILDILEKGDTSEPEPEGLNTYDLIWDNHFCPIIVYSAQNDLFGNNRPHHPFVRSVQKGSGSDERVLKELKELRPHVEEFQRAENQVRESLSMVMRHLAPLAFKTLDDAKGREKIITRAGRRRVAAMMDEPVAEESKLASWEIYLYPPLSGTPLLGDILQTAEQDIVLPSNFRVILTPSCDMVPNSKGETKVQEVLVAKCHSMKEALESIGLKGASTATLRERLPSRLLSQGYSQSIIPLPALAEAIPTMAADLRELELIPINQIGSDAGYLRIASVDSPFRELVAWAYMQISCRPGLPERDLLSWTEEIVKTVKT